MGCPGRVWEAAGQGGWSDTAALCHSQVASLSRTMPEQTKGLAYSHSLRCSEVRPRWARCIAGSLALKFCCYMRHVKHSGRLRSRTRAQFAAFPLAQEKSNCSNAPRRIFSFDDETPGHHPIRLQEPPCLMTSNGITLLGNPIGVASWTSPKTFSR